METVDTANVDKPVCLITPSHIEYRGAYGIITKAIRARNEYRIKLDSGGIYYARPSNLLILER